MSQRAYRDFKKGIGHANDIYEWTIQRMLGLRENPDKYKRRADELKQMAIERSSNWVDVWYDHATRNWVVQRKDKDGNQIGDADYVYSRSEAQTLKDQYLKQGF